MEQDYEPVTVDFSSQTGHSNSGVTLCGQDKEPYLTVTFDAPVVGLWSSPGKNAPFVCIEPWYGRTDDVRYSGSFEDKKWMQKLAPGQEFNGGYTIEIHP